MAYDNQSWDEFDVDVTLYNWLLIYFKSYSSNSYLVNLIWNFLCLFLQEEWVVCRVFQKSNSSAVKKPQQAQSSQPSLGSPCDTNSMVNEFGDIDQLPNLNTMANFSSGFNNNIPTQSYNTDNNLNMNIHNLNMNWAAAREAATTLPSLAWPSSLLSPNLSMNSLLLKALQLRSTYNQAREATSSDHNSLIQPLPQGISRFECDHLNSNFQASSSSKVLDNSLPPQSQPEQPFNLDSIWWKRENELN